MQFIVTLPMQSLFAPFISYVFRTCALLLLSSSIILHISNIFNSNSHSVQSTYHLQFQVLIPKVPISHLSNPRGCQSLAPSPWMHKFPSGLRQWPSVSELLRPSKTRSNDQHARPQYQSKYQHIASQQGFLRFVDHTLMESYSLQEVWVRPSFCPFLSRLQARIFHRESRRFRTPRKWYSCPYS
jgi:hypothetical protein